ncbi:putative hydrolase of the HAD superfamily [Ekhidna lutea]|uniref:Putative hydrolase of the HAD superfamily n=1 Tax=Ekhidna lutea TaxID=447679 RepID=A0A239HZQ3_EKHLU|nr:HAD family phosphatase [Ekhidna lutea]SNS86662.1 putative hydrolase of the HAD superfamily [Ekhidna lutea]
MSDQLQGIDAIIFDFGNVLIDLDYPRVIRRFSEVANKNQEEIEELVVTAPVLQKFEMGMIGPDEFRASINKLLGTQMGEMQFEDIWNSMLKSITKERMNKVLKIGERFDTYILSNTNIIHEIAYEEMIMVETGRPSLRDFVKEVYYSHEIGMRKPNLNCYNFVIDDIGIYASRMLFLDDRLDNVEAAKKAGMKAIQILDPDNQLNKIFELE